MAREPTGSAQTTSTLDGRQSRSRHDAGSAPARITEGVQQAHRPDHAPPMSSPFTGDINIARHSTTPIRRKSGAAQPPGPGPGRQGLQLEGQPGAVTPTRDQGHHRSTRRPGRPPATSRTGRRPTTEHRSGNLQTSSRRRVRHQPPQTPPSHGHQIRLAVRYLATINIATINEHLIDFLNAPSCGCGIARTSRSNVSRLTRAPSWATVRAPARPANARPIAARVPCSSGVRRACRAVRPSTCSMNVLFGQSIVCLQKEPARPLHHLPAGDRSIGQRALIAAVHAVRHRTTPSTCHARLPRLHRDLHQVAATVDLLDNHPSRVR